MFRPPDAFNFNGTDVAQRWAKWRKTFETFFTAAEVAKKAAAVQIAILLHTAGSEAQEIHSQFTFLATEDKDDVTTVLNKFGTYCNPQKNVVFERYRFWSKEHCESEPIDKWVKEVIHVDAAATDVVVAAVVATVEVDVAGVRADRETGTLIEVVTIKTSTTLENHHSQMITCLRNSKHYRCQQ